jgi:8-oxo-dGTP pyrophosphatase MutT (NUDIX family)
MPASAQTRTPGGYSLRATLIDERPIELDLAELRRRLRRPGRPAASLYGDQGARPDPERLTPASVLVPIVARSPELTVLFTQRTAHLKSHSGQVSFPGGRSEPHDRSAESTALRETEEEIGIAPERVELVARLPEYRTRTGYRITPVVGVVAAPLELRLDAREVEEAFEVPLSFLLDPANRERRSREFQGSTVWYFAFEYRSRTIWGATAGMLVNLYQSLLDAP